MADVLEGLNERQREAVLETEGYVRVIAGAGSGKTKLLVSRYAYLVQDYGIDSSNILCVTFTNKAAGEMKSRIRAMIGDSHDVSLICTYHGFCNRLLRENPEKLFLNKQFQIIDEYQQKTVLSEIYQKYELKLDYASFEQILKRIGGAKRDLAYVPRICSPAPCQIMEKIEDRSDRIVEEYLQRQKATYSLDFQDLISFAIYLLRTDEEIREKWQNRLNYIMVDEFQDSSATELALVDILSGMYENLMIVGDPDQNIYEWRGSDVKLLVDFDKKHEPTKTIILNQNYRSTPQILQCANTLIQKNDLRLKKDLFTKNAAGAPVIHYHSQTEAEEMERVAENIIKLHDGGLKYSDFAILYRSTFLSRAAEKKLAEKSIPYEIYGGVRFYDRMEIRDVLAYLRLIAYDEDESFRRIANTPRRRFGRAKMNYLDQLKRTEDGTLQTGVLQNGKLENSLFSILVRHLEDPGFSNSDVGGFVKFVQDMRGKYRGERISDIVNEVTRDSGYEKYIRELGDEERLDNLAEFKRIANEFEREFGENVSLEEFLSQIAVQSEAGASESADRVKLMTIHSSKGLEFPVVFLLGLNEGVFPSSRTIGDRKKLGLEEERRLCYVAMTRARKRLFLMESEGTTPAGMKSLVSRFLMEMGEENYLRIGQISEDLRKESLKYTEKLNREMWEEATDPATQIRRVGDTVEHHIFGTGKIEAVDEKRGSYRIQFEKLKQPRNISVNYFAKEHKDLRLEVRPEERPEKGPEERPENRREKISGEAQTRQIPSLPPVSFSGTLSQDGDIFAQEPAPELSEFEVQSQALEAENVDSDTDRTVEEKAGKAENIGAADEVDERVPADGAETIIREDANEDVVSEDANENVDTKADIEPEASDIEPDEEAERAAYLKELKANSPNLWKREDVPHAGWQCVGVEDLGAPVGICEMCGYQIIRYAHHMVHPRFRALTVGCVCAGRMEGSVEQARRREQDFKKNSRTGQGQKNRAAAKRRWNG